MNRLDKILEIRQKLRKGHPSVGSWMQIPNASIAEIMGQAGYDWVAVDLEHGAISIDQLPDLFRALELGGTLPLVRLAQGTAKDCKQALDAGAGGVIVPMVETAEHFQHILDVCRWPPVGKRGVGFSRANLFGKHFSAYSREAREPFLVAMIEHVRAVKNLDAILSIEGLDAILIGPYDLSASMGLTAEFIDPGFIEIMRHIRVSAENARIPCGIHVVTPSSKELQGRLLEGYRFIAYSIDAVFLIQSAGNPLAEHKKL